MSSTESRQKRYRRRISRAGLEGLRARIHEAKPWLRATGPITAAGKAASSLNALRHGEYSAAAELQKQVFRERVRLHKRSKGNAD